jgi:outer membrane protein insertion porin family
MMVRCLIFLLLLPALSFGQQQFYGTRASSLTLTGSSTDSDLQAVPLHSGDILTEDNVRAAIQALYDTHRYSYIEVDAAPESGGTHLTFIVRPYYFFSTFRLDPDNLLDRSISGFFRLPFGEKFSQTEVDRISAATTDLLQSEGYPDAKVTPQIHLDESTHLASVVFHTDAEHRAQVGTVKVTGGEQTFSKPGELEGVFDLRQGTAFSGDKLEAGLRRIRAKFAEVETGAFLNTRVDVQKDYKAVSNTMDLTLTVDPGKFTLVEVRGYEIPEKKLKTLVPVYEEGAVDADLVEEGRSRIRAFMQQEGYFEATVKSETIDAPLDNAVQINYDIVKGEKHRIQSVRIEGNKYFSEEDIRTRMKVRNGGFMNRGIFSPEILDQDILGIQGMYRDAGLQDTTVKGHYEDEANHTIDVVISIEEGRRLPIQAIAFQGNDKVPEIELRERSGLHAEQIYTPVAVDAARNALTLMYYAKGFPEALIEEKAERTPANDEMLVTFRVTEGASYTIGKIIVAGNTLTAEKIVHRNSGLYAGTPYNPEAVLQAQQKLYATGLFQRVDIVPLAEDLPGVRNVLIQLEDNKPIQLTPGIGYQSDEGARVTMEVSDNNLFGLDRSITFRARSTFLSTSSTTNRDQLLQSTYREPRLFNRNLEGSASLSFERSHQPAFDASNWDFSIQTVKKLATGRNLLLSASYETINLQDIRVNPHAEEFPDLIGVIQIARIGASYIRDRRDDPIDPKKGTYNTTTFQVAGTALGSEVNFVKLLNQSSYYRPLNKAVFASSLRIGWNEPYGKTNELPITERYFAGGSTTLRGLSLDEAGPEGGGDAMVIANFEYRFPFEAKRIKNLGAAFFYDTGNVFSRISDVRIQDFTHTVGTGLRYKTPVGPVRLDFGLNLHPELDSAGDMEKRFRVFFTLGHAF